MKHAAALIAALILLSGCGKEYRAEREFWKAEQSLKSIKRTMLDEKGPEVLTPVIEAFKQVYEKYPSTGKAAESLFVISNLYIRQKKYDEAIETLRLVLRDYSQEQDRAPEARYGLAGLYELQGNWEKAEEAYWDTAENHPFHQRGLYSPVHIILHFKKAKDQKELDRVHEKALDFYDRMIKQTGPIQASAGITNYLGLAELSYGDWQKARALWMDIHKKYPDSPYAPLSLLAAGEISWKKQDFGSALESYQEFLKLFPKHPLAKRTVVQVGAIYEAQRDFTKAREWYEKGLQENAKDEISVADITLLLGRSYQKEGNWEKAAAYFSEIESKYPASSAALQIPFMRAAHYEASGETDKAKAILDGAIQQYEGLMASGKNTRMAAYAERLQHAALAEKGDWQQILKNFDRKIQEEKTEVRKGNWYFLKAVVTENRLQDKEAALGLYKNFVARYPDHPLVDLAKTRQQALLQKA